MNGTKSTLPENLTALWDYTHNRECAKSGAECGKLWQKLEEKLTEKLKNAGIPGLDGDDRESKARDAANEYLVTILKSERRPDHIFSTSLLVRDMRKYLARTRNPVQYEMSRILSTALLELERDGLIKRGSPFAGRLIQSGTTFTLADSPKSEKCIADRADYREWCVRNRQSYVVGSRPVRNCEKRRMITPLDARELVLFLLKAFGSWTMYRDLLWSMQFHIPEQMRLVSLAAPGEGDEENGASSPSADAPDYVAEEYVYDRHDVQQALVIAEETAGRIWQRICRVSDRVFCLYYLPKEIFDRPAVTLESLGASSTVGDQNKKIRKIFFSERFEFENKTGDGGRQGEAVRLASVKILEILTGRCTEKGYPADLYTVR